MPTIMTLDELTEILRSAPNAKNSGAQVAYAEQHGLPHAHGEIDWSGLPTFGGDEPSDTTEIWSWDETRMLVGNTLEIIRRPPRTDADVLRAAYRAAGRTQVDFARDVFGCSLSAFTDWLRGEPCMSPIVRLAWLIARHPELAEEIDTEFRR